MIHLIHRAGQAADNIYRSQLSSLLKAGDISLTEPRQAVVLIAVEEADEPPSQTDLCDRTGIDRSTLADIVRRMVKAGLLERRRTRTDARKYSIRLTDSGLRAAARARRAREDVETALGLSARERSDLAKLLHKLIDAHTDTHAKAA